MRVLLLLTLGLAHAEPAPPPAELAAAPTPTPEQIAAAKAAFVKVHAVLLHPRCMNCHPNGDRPLQTDQSRPHAMNISRKSLRAGLKCETCHREENSDAIGIIGGPPGAPHWGLPDEKMPLIFQDRSPAQLCTQLKDPAQNGHRTLAQLLHHVSKDKLVLWGWKPGSGRSVPPLSHADFVAQFKVWVDGGGACPE